MDTPDLDVTITAKSRWGRPVLRLNRPVRYRLDSHCFEDEDDTSLFALSIKVPRGYETDLASIPFFLWPLLSPWGPWRRAAIIHDYLCDVSDDRFLADSIFRHVMEVDGLRLCVRCLLYYSVRCYWIAIGRWHKGSSYVRKSESTD